MLSIGNGFDVDNELIPLPKRRICSDIVDESYYTPPTHNKLHTLYADCLTEIVPYIELASLCRLLQTGNRMLFDKITRNVTFLGYQLADRTKGGINGIMCSLAGYCTKLTTLYIGKCSFDGVLLSNVLFPPTLKILVVERDCQVHAGKKSTFMSNTTVLQKLPNLTRLQLDCFAMREYPIDLSASPSLTKLLLSVEKDDTSDHCQDLVDKVTQLTSLRVMDSFGSENVVLNCAKLTSLKSLGLNSVSAQNVPDSLERLTLDHPDDHWDIQHSIFWLFSERTFGHLTRLVMNLAEFNPTVTLPKIAKIAPLIESLVVNVDPLDFRCNIWAHFFHLKTVDESLCFDPKFWHYIPKGTFFEGCLLNRDGAHVWEASDWFKHTDESVGQVLKEMPPFGILSLEEDVCTDEFLLAIPEKVLTQAQSLYLRSTPVAQKLISLATATVISADFCNYIIDFSKCIHLRHLMLECRSRSELSDTFIEKAIQSLPATVEKLDCFPKPVITNFPQLSVSILGRFKKLESLSASLVTTECLNSLPAALQQLRLHNKTSIIPELYLLMKDRENHSSLKSVICVVDDECCATQFVDGWNMKIVRSKYTWTRAESFDLMK